MQTSKSPAKIHFLSKRLDIRVLAVLCAVLLTVMALPFSAAATTGAQYEGWYAVSGSGITYDNATHAITLDGTSRQELFLNLEGQSSEANLAQFGSDVMTDYTINFDLNCNAAGSFSVAVMGADPGRLYWNAVNAMIDTTNIGIMWRGYWYIDQTPACVDQWGYASGISQYHNMYGDLKSLDHHVTVTKSGYNVTITVNTLRWDGNWHDAVYTQTASLPDDIGLPTGGYIGLLAENGANVTVKNMKITNNTAGHTAYDEFFTAPSADFGDEYQGWRHISASGTPSDYVSFNDTTKAISLNGMSVTQMLYLNRWDVDDYNSGDSNIKKFNSAEMTDFIIDFNMAVTDYTNKDLVDSGGHDGDGGGAVSLAFMGTNKNRIDTDSVTARIDYTNIGIMWRGYSNIATPTSISDNFGYASGISQWHWRFNDASPKHVVITKTGYTVTMDVSDGSFVQTATLPSDIGLSATGYVGLLVEGANVTITDMQVINTATGKANGFFGAEHFGPADYTAVNAQTDRWAGVANKGIYTAASLTAVADAIAAVEYGLDSDEQAAVDGFAAAISDAIDALTVDNNAIVGASLTLQNNLKLNFAVKKSIIDTLTDPVVSFTTTNLQGEDYVVDVTEKTASGDYYLYSYANIGPDRMGVAITAKLTGTYGGTAYESTPLTYSVKQYCCDLLGTTSVPQLRTLLVDLLNYGAASQTYAGYDTANLVNADLTETQRGYASAAPELSATRSLSTGDYTAAWYSVVLNLKDTVAIKYTLNTNGADVTSVKITDEADAPLATIDAADFTDAGDGKKVVLYNGLTAIQMRKNVKATAYNGETPVSKTLTYSIAAYATQKQGQGNALADLVVAMMKYGDSAVAYNALG